MTASIAGNASDETKAFVLEFIHIPTRHSNRKFFAPTVRKGMQLVEVSVGTMAEEPSRLEAKVVVTLTVGEDMTNLGGSLHGGCVAFLIDLCSSLAIGTLRAEKDGKYGLDVSQTLNIVYHSPAMPGDELRIVNKTMSLGGRTTSARTEIWNDTHRRLVASGVHIKMAPSAPQSKL